MTSAIKPRVDNSVKEFAKHFAKGNVKDTGDIEWDFDMWADNATFQPIYVKLLSKHFPIVFTDLNGILNYTFRVNICNYLHFIKEARRASEALNSLIEELPFIPNPDQWGYQRPINPRNFDIVSAPLITFHEKCISDLLICDNLNFWFAFDGFVTVNVENLIQVCFCYFCLLFAFCARIETFAQGYLLYFVCFFSLFL